VNLFLRDRLLGTNFSLTQNGGFIGSDYASMTPDGRFVAFRVSSFTVFSVVQPGLAIQPYQMVLWDSQQTKYIAVSNSVGSSIQAMRISPNGSRIAYFNASSLCVWDRGLNTNRALLTALPGSGVGLRFSADSRWLTYSSRPTASATNQVYLYDFVTGTNILVSRNIYGVGVTNGHANSPDISADGRFVVYRCFANDLVAGDTNGVSDVFLYDSVTGINMRLSGNIASSPGDNTRSSVPFFSGNGRTLVFRSYAPNVAPNDFNHYDDVVAFQSLYATIIETNGINPSITWPAAPGKTFRVEYKNDLTDALWQNVPAPVSILNNVGSITDPTPAPGRRFYRVVLEN
jgi:hypothetical protein